MSTLLDIAGVSRRFRGLIAINDVSLSVPEGSICSLIGPNGAGKSTLFNLISGFYPPSAGTIRFDGERIDRLGTMRIARRGVARAFQIARPFPGLTVAENVRVGALFGRAGPRDVAASLNDALSLAGLADWAQHPASSLTVGFLRRLELARAIAARPRLLLADEPCAGLNHTETEEIVDLLREIRRRGVTVLLVEHDMAAVMRVSDHVFVLDAGSKIAEGTPEAVARDARVIAAYLGTPVPA
ncbi:MAG TPA: ABC transporter ATP-binding protein [Acetobacteraceae bacterium]|nr:ABC transporter ATP-binding protein [Acetobacteraceae bacterium]